MLGKKLNESSKQRGLIGGGTAKIITREWITSIKRHWLFIYDRFKGSEWTLRRNLSYRSLDLVLHHVVYIKNWSHYNNHFNKLPLNKKFEIRRISCSFTFNLLTIYVNYIMSTPQFHTDPLSSTQGPHLFSTQNLSVPHQKYLSSTYPSVPHQKPPCSIHQVCVKLRGFAVEPRDFGGKRSPFVLNWQGVELRETLFSKNEIFKFWSLDDFYWRMRMNMILNSKNGMFWNLQDFWVTVDFAARFRTSFSWLANKEFHKE